MHVGPDAVDGAKIIFGYGSSASLGGASAFGPARRHELARWRGRSVIARVVQGWRSPALPVRWLCAAHG